MVRRMVTGTQGSELVCGRYALDRKLGKGGLGEVFLALDTQLNRWVAIKRLHAGPLEAGERAASAISEARHLASLQHPNIVTVFDFVEHEDDVMVVMEFLQGQTLEELAAPLPREDFVEMARQSLEGLASAHSLGMIHRDIKPGNLMLAALPGGKFQVKILDFGLAKIIQRPSMQTMDHTGSLLGSVYTMTPEQLEREPLDHRADLYSLGCVFYYALTLRNPFEGDTIVAVIASHLQHSVHPLHTLRPDLPPALCAWVESLFARDVARRPADALTAAAQLQVIAKQGAAAISKPVLKISTSPPKKNPLWPWLAGAGVAAVALAFAAIVWSGTPMKDSAPPKVEAPSPAPSANSAQTLSPGDRENILIALGKLVIVEGTVSRTGENKSGTIRFLNFQGGSRGDLSLVFFVEKGDFSKSRLEEFVGRRIRVTGTVSTYQGNPQIEIKDWSQITGL